MGDILYYICESCDATSAFLQAKGREEARRVWTHGVPELKRALSVSDRSGLRLLKAAYGITNAPWVFRKYVDQQIHQAGGKGIMIEPCVWIILDETDKVVGAIGAHVDDFGTPGNHDSQTFLNVRETLRKMLRWSPWQATPCMWAGMWISQEPDGKETALAYGYVMLGKIRKAKADLHIRRMTQLVRSAERPTVTQLQRL